MLQTYNTTHSQTSRGTCANPVYVQGLQGAQPSKATLVICTLEGYMTPGFQFAGRSSLVKKYCASNPELIINLNISFPFGVLLVSQTAPKFRRILIQLLGRSTYWKRLFKTAVQSQKFMKNRLEKW